jgi:asparagine synthase (glutamine-hydrolysing)
MCGIVGLWHWTDRNDDVPATIRGMLAQIRHRGPDEMGLYARDGVGLGTARLSIIDIPGGHQPMLDPARRFCLVYNGEIYNYIELRRTLEAEGYVFETRSDTEVLLRAWMAWGSGSLARFNGMFAFALYDRALDSLVLARDRFGKRPLYYRSASGRLTFASELKSFLAVPGFDFTMDPESLASIYRIWVPLPAATGFRDIQQVPPGCLLTVSAQKPPIIERYYDLPLAQRSSQCDFAAAAEDARARLDASVSLRLRSDVEVGTYLSGGIDSAIVTALAVRHASRTVRTFSVGFEDLAFDESPAQDVMSDHLGTRNERLVISSSDIATAFPDAVRHAETPVFRTALTPMYLLSRKVQEAGIKVVLTGEGADEVFLGYDIFKETALRVRLNAGYDDAEARRLIDTLYFYESHLHAGQTSALFALFRQFGDQHDDPLFSHQLRFHNSSFSTRLLRDSFSDPLRSLRHWMDEEIPSWRDWTPLARAQWLEFRTLLAGYLLSSQGDRASMAHSVETRCPFLDPDIVAWAGKLPADFLFHPSGEEKHILRAAFRDLLPPSIADRPKQPYRSPDLTAFRDARPDYLESVLSDAELRSIGFLDTNFASKLIRKVLGDQGPASPREGQTFVLLLSTVLLYRFFCRREALVSDRIDDLLTTTLDERT